VELIQSFSLEKHSGPYESWPRKTRLFFNGADTGATVSGYVIDGQYRAGACYLLIISYDCPYEESNDFLLLNAAFEIVADSSLTPPMYGSYLLDTHWPVSDSAIRLHYYHSEIFELGLKGDTSTDGKGCRLTVEQIHDYRNDERSTNAVIDLQMSLARVNAAKDGDSPTLETWRRAWTELGATHCDDQTLRSLVLAYEEPERAYHSYAHIRDCFDVFTKLSHLAQRSWEIRIALWFHDAVYDSKRSDNELRSAEWAKETAIRFGVAPAVAHRIHGLVMATRHQAVPADADQQVLVDVDLSILGAEGYRFAEYERGIRWEYRWVPRPLFKGKRKAILKSFLEREWIYNTRECRELYEQRARENLARSIAGEKSSFLGKLLTAVVSWYRRR
jgi:predicted metal-dependent HD superfamily phosphohydrolase